MFFTGLMGTVKDAAAAETCTRLRVVSREAVAFKMSCLRIRILTYLHRVARLWCLSPVEAAGQITAAKRLLDAQAGGDRAWCPRSRGPDSHWPASGELQAGHDWLRKW